MRTMKHWALAAMTATALALAGCGGGGSSGGMRGMMDQEMDQEAPVAAVMIPNAMYLNEDNMPSAASVTIQPGDSATNNGVMFSCPAGGDACEVEVMADGSVTSTGGEATAALTSDAMVQVAKTKSDAAKETALAAEEHRDRIIGKDRAIESASNLLQLPTAAAIDGNLHESEIAISRGPGAMARVRATDPAGYSVSDDPALPNTGWAGTHLTRSVPGATQHLFVYTDIDPPTRIQFYNFDGVATTPRLYADAAIVSGGTGLDGATTPATPSTAIPALSLVTAGAPVATLFNRGNLDSNFNSPGPAADGSVTQRFRGTANGGPAGGGGITFRGNFNGAAGTYGCTAATGTDCVVTIAPNGTYTAPDTWSFTPELNATAWRQDQEFMSFGWWLQEPNSSNGTYTFQYYADGNAYTAPPGTIITGPATYNGRAAGKFVVQEIDDTGVTGGEAGQFTAAATLNASFGATANSISGSISGFQSDNSDVDVSGWVVTLHPKALGAQANLPNAFPAATQTDPTRPGYNGVTAVMGDQTAQGDWAGQYFGDANTGNTRNAYPLGVGGTFQADNEAASIAGAFGARR